MPKTGFFNDNEYRAYPFVDKNASRERQQQLGGGAAYGKIKQAIHSAIVDAGFIFGIDCTGTPQQELFGLRVQLKSIAANPAPSNGFTATFSSTAASVELVFTTGTIPEDWLTIKAATASEATGEFACATETPRWRGYIVAAATNTLRESFIAAGIVPDETGHFVFHADADTDQFEFEIEPCRIQNKARSYLRSITVGNFARLQVPGCGEEESTNGGGVPVAVSCIRGPINFKEGYNCQISQINRSNTFTISARTDAGAKKDAEYCANNGEFPLFPNESKPAGSKFYSGGPSCDELMYTINGVGGRNVAIVPGIGITISTESNKIVVGAQGGFISDCIPTPEEDETNEPTT